MSLKIAFASFFVAAVAAASCSSGPGIGGACSTQQDCALVTSGNDVALCILGQCTRSCVTDVDCGCSPGTWPGEGDCDRACITVASGTSNASICARTCATNADCPVSGMSCQPIPQFVPGRSYTDGSQGGFSACLWAL